MALAKIGGLDVLFRLFSQIMTPPAVYDELVTAGLRLGAPDAELLEARYRAQDLIVISPAAVSLNHPALLGPGEEQSIQLASKPRRTGSSSTISLPGTRRSPTWKQPGWGPG
jgi:predicted nucleic acid-binding protein